MEARDDIAQNEQNINASLYAYKIDAILQVIKRKSFI